jgi:hypothetical protein
MAALVWRYTPQDVDTAHLVYTGAPVAGPGNPGLALISACGLAKVAVAEHWRGVAPRQLARLREIRRCTDCAGRFPYAAAP